MRYEDDDEYEDDDQPDLPWPPAGQPSYPGPPPRRGSHRGVLLTLTAVIAAGAGFLAVTAVCDVSASPAADATPASSPRGNLPGEGTGNGTGPLPIPSTGPGEVLHLEIGGTVTAVSATSITLGAHGQDVTAAVTRSTAVTGRVHAISGVRIGDLVSVQITGTDGKLTATAIQDPASIP